MFGRLFGGKKAAAGPNPQETIEELRNVEERLLKKQEFLERKIVEEQQKARANATSNKRVAMQALKRKKLHEQEQQRNDGILAKIEQQRLSLENASANVDILKTMGEAAKAMKQVHESHNIDDVHELMEDIAEQQDLANEVAEAISSPTGFANGLDQDDLEAEFAALEDEVLNEQLVNVDPAPAENIGARLPAAPTDKLPSRPVAKKEDDDMADLEQWAAS
uniref:Charged multivesicular body protein 4b n=1 Tax=Panagrellus redivivus TaxID=6233 RepID=A0A7E5A0F2_PANRE